MTDFTAPVPGEHHFRDRVQRVVTVRLATAIRVYLLRQTVQHIVAELIAFSVLVCQPGQPPVSVVPECRPAPHRVRPAAHPPLPVALPARYPPHRAGILHQPARRIRLVMRRATVRQYHLHQVTAVVIPVARAVALRVCHPYQPRAFVVEPGRLRAGTIRMPRELPVFVPLKVFIPPTGIGYLYHLAVAVILIPGVLLQRVGHGKKIAAFIVLTAPTVPRRIHFRFRFVPYRVPLCLCHPPQRVVRLRDMPQAVIHIAPFAALSVGHPQQQSFFVAPAERHHLPGFVLVRRHLILRIPLMKACPARPVCHTYHTFSHPPVQTVSCATVGMVARHAPACIIRPFIPAPLVIIPFAAGLPVQRHAVVFVVSKLTQQVPRAVVHAVQVAGLVIVVTTQQ
ncbi:hypothetical protein C3995_01523 [Escherichia marmotae]|uniref:Uncharacterized protein n=1 Tax=Escherichia marmotae TaxID=1499973 RepID=A0A370VA39_9ESCH|nr:hypothetical protein C4A13_01621 [Escherichia marmotae]RDR36944.1 hypothetical protein C4A14_01521 [Escherichia marmotae]RDR37283.1 hypothetical protein C4A11_01434 [Escherichia marmotae]RDR87706.1 hypothetical protein C4A00_01435 [Escherichia marmotae]RDS22839.1 hypothetical protein C3995_01523 [Escherichia marmotae]